MLASGSLDTTIRLWNVTTGTLIQTLTGHIRAIYSLRFSPDGHMLASGSSDDTIRLWHVATGVLRNTLASPNRKTVSSVDFSPDGHMLASGSPHDTIHLWHVATGVPQSSLSRYSQDDSVRFSPDGRTLASWDSSGTAHWNWSRGKNTIQLWHVATGALLQILTSLKLSGALHSVRMGARSLVAVTMVPFICGMSPPALCKTPLPDTGVGSIAWISVRMDAH